MALTEQPVARESLLPFIPDFHLPYIVPALVYWILGFTFHQIERWGGLSQYKLHIPAESRKKDRASRRDVIKFALIQQAAQCSLGYLTANDTELFYSDAYNVNLWAQRLSKMQSGLRGFICNDILGGLERVYSTILPIPHIRVPFYMCMSSYQASSETLLPVQWHWKMAWVLYWVAIPLLQFVFAMMLADSFQYFTHRALHVNKWLYKNIHSMHHDIYVPFAYGAFYNHPLETIPIDCIGLPTCLYLAGLNNRQSALFGIIWTFKTVVDHCGYNFPWNPANIICTNSVLFHDLHHQAWGMKYNFSVYTSFWDKIFDTYWDGCDSSARERYQRGKEKAGLVTKKGKFESEDTGSSTALNT